MINPKCSTWFLFAFLGIIFVVFTVISVNIYSYLMITIYQPAKSNKQQEVLAHITKLMLSIYLDSKDMLWVGSM